MCHLESSKIKVRVPNVENQVRLNTNHLLKSATNTDQLQTQQCSSQGKRLVKNVYYLAIKEKFLQSMPF